MVVARLGHARLWIAVWRAVGAPVVRAAGWWPALTNPRRWPRPQLFSCGNWPRTVPADALVLGIGVGVAGIVGQDEVVRMAPHLGWRDVALLELLRARLPSPLLIRAGNDADLGALAEHRRGAGVGVSNLLYIGCDDFGVGGGIIVDGKLYRGEGGFAGEIGHMLIDPRGRGCNCGSRG